MNRGFLLDTNVPSEQIRSRPDPRIANWIYAQPERNLFLSTITLGEIRKGIVLLPHGRRRDVLERWFETDLVPRFGNRILPATQEVADRWGRLTAERQRGGVPLGTADGLIAATALEHTLTLVTRNVKDFSDLGVTLLTPWEPN